MCEPCLYLRPVNMEDALLLYDWRNEESVRQNSFHTEELVYEEHFRWLENILKTFAARHFYILMLGNIPIGQIRLSEEDNFGLINYSIDREYRSRGYGRKILSLIEERVLCEKTSFTLVGYVKRKNGFSQRIFEALGYSRTMEKDFFKYEKKIGEI